MRILRHIIFLLLLVFSCSVNNLDDAIDFDDIEVRLLPDKASLHDDVVFTITVTNGTNAPIWYNHCGMAREVPVDSDWKGTGAVICYLETEGVRINPGERFETNPTLRYNATGKFRLVVNLKDKNRDSLPVDVRTTNHVTIVQGE